MDRGRGLFLGEVRVSTLDDYESQAQATLHRAKNGQISGVIGLNQPVSIGSRAKPSTGISWQFPGSKMAHLPGFRA